MNIVRLALKMQRVQSNNARSIFTLYIGVNDPLLLMYNERKKHE